MAAKLVFLINSVNFDYFYVLFLVFDLIINQTYLLE
jgi:hypothetical protein